MSYVLCASLFVLDVLALLKCTDMLKAIDYKLNYMTLFPPYFFIYNTTQCDLVCCNNTTLFICNHEPIKWSLWKLEMRSKLEKKLGCHFEF